jgi:peptide/nickel transport system permease protein
VTAATPRYLSRAWRGWRSLPPLAKVGIVLVGLITLVGIIGPYLAPYGPSAETSDLLQGPSSHHWLGTTTTGEDVLSELLAGTRATLIVGYAVGVIGTALSAVLGILSGYLGGVEDEVLSLFTNFVLVLPALPLLVVLLAYQTAQNTLATIIILGVLGWPWGARVIRAQTLSLRNRDFVAAARETGERTWRIIFFEILPNETSLIAASFVQTVLYAVGTSVALAFLGLTNTATWSLGTILFWAESQDALQLGAWWWWLPAGLVVALFGTGLVLVNFGLDQLGNPRLRDTAGRRSPIGRTWRQADPTVVVDVQAAATSRRPVPALAQASQPAGGGGTGGSSNSQGHLR